MKFDNSSLAPERSFWINLRGAESGTFTLEISDPVLGRNVSETFNFPVTEDTIEETLQSLIIPRNISETCGLKGTSKCADAVKVVSLGSNAFLVFFLGERLFEPVSLNLTATSLDGFSSEYFQNFTNDILQQNSDIVYTGVEVLNISMGDLDTVVNVRGTSAVTNIQTQTGDDTIFISSEANQNIDNARSIDVLLGWLDYLEKDLTIDVRTGRHRLLISDEKSPFKKGPATLTNNSLTNIHDDLGDIFFYTNGDLAWSGGVDLWLGKGSDILDVLSVPSNPSGPPLRTTTCVHAGDGNDALNIKLDTNFHDGVVFVANGQAGDDSMNASLSSHPVILLGERGSDTLVGGSGNDIILGDLGRVTWTEEEGDISLRRLNFEQEYMSVHNIFEYPVGVVVAQVGNGGYGDFSDGLIHNVSEIFSAFTEIGGDDYLECGDGDNVAFGGFGSDTVIGGNQRDILFGDSAMISFYKDSEAPASALSIDCCLGNNDTIFGGSGEVDYLVGGGFNDTLHGEEGPDLIFGDHAFIAFDQDVPFKLKYAATTHQSCSGGSDSIYGGDGDDIAFGGADSDKIFGGPGQDVLFGDFGEYDSSFEFLPFQNYRSIIAYPDDAGDDEISGQEGDDFIFGQEGSDLIDGGAGNDDIIGGHARLHGYDTGDILEGGEDDDYIAGDNAQILRIRLSSASTYPWILGSVWKTYPKPFDHAVIRNLSRYDDIDFVEGNDVINGGGGNDVLHGQRGNDTINGGEGEDELYGELGYDDLEGGPGNDILLGDVGHSLRRFDNSGNPILQTDLTGAPLSPPVWLKDIILEDVGKITQISRISTKVDTNSLFAENVTAASLLFVANAYENGVKIGDEEQGGWPTYMILYDLVERFDDILTDNAGTNILIGQRGDDLIKGNGILIGDGGWNTIPQKTNLPRIYQVYRALSSPAGSGFLVDETAEETTGELLNTNRRHLHPIQMSQGSCGQDSPGDDPNLIMEVVPPRGSDFGVLFDADFDLYPSQYRYPDYLSSIIDSQLSLSDAQIDSHLVKDLIGSSTLATDKGYCLQPMFRITPGMALQKQHLHGNDEIVSGEATSIVVGDDIYGSAPLDLTELKSVGDLQLTIDRLVFDLGRRLSTLEVDTKFFLDGAQVSRTEVLLASDSIETSQAGQALVVGDFLRMYGRSFLGADLSENQVSGMVNRLRDIELVLLDVHLAMYELHENLLLRTDGLPNQKRQQKSHHELILSSDRISSFGDGDVVIGDMAMLFTQVDRPGEEGFEFEGVELSLDQSLRTLMTQRDEMRDLHVENDLNPSLLLNENAARKLPYADVPFLFTACTDEIELSTARNLAAGDFGFVGLVASSQAAAEVRDDYVDSIVDIAKRPGVASFLLNPVLLKFKIPFFYERYGSRIAKAVEPTLFADSISGQSTENIVLGEFLTMVGAGDLSTGPDGFLFDAKERGVFATYDNAQFAQEFDGDLISVVDGTVVDGQKGKDEIISRALQGRRRRKNKPTPAPTLRPTLPPSLQPSTAPTSPPTLRPTTAPTSPPTLRPSTAPTSPPTHQQTTAQTPPPTHQQTTAPTSPPTLRPTTAQTPPPTPQVTTDSITTSDATGQVVQDSAGDVEFFAQVLFYDNEIIAQWINDIYNAPVFYSTFVESGVKNPQCHSDLFDEFIPPDIQGGIY